MTTPCQKKDKQQCTQNKTQKTKDLYENPNKNRGSAQELETDPTAHAAPYVHVAHKLQTW